MISILLVGDEKWERKIESLDLWLITLREKKTLRRFRNPFDGVIPVISSPLQPDLNLINLCKMLKFSSLSEKQNLAAFTLVDKVEWLKICYCDNVESYDNVVVVLSNRASAAASFETT